MRQTPPESFEVLYRADEDPWSFATSRYEQARYAATLAALPDPPGRMFEPGCSVGILTEQLAARGAAVVAWDCSATAVARARRRCADRSDVVVEVGEIPHDWPAGRFDVVVLSEIGYYFDRPLLAHVRDRAVESLAPGGTLVAVHWLGSSPDHVLGGDDVHAVLGAHPGLVHVQGTRTPGFRLDRWGTGSGSGTDAPPATVRRRSRSSG